MSSIPTPQAPVFDVQAADFQAQVVDASRDTPVLVDFWAGWCAPCKALAPVLEKLAAAADGAFVLAKVDTDANRELAMAQGIRSLPTVRLFVGGAPVAEFMGAHPEASVRAFLEQHLPRAEDTTATQTVASLLDAGDASGARAALEALGAAARETAPVRALEARLWLLEHAAALEAAGSDAPAAGELESRYASALHSAAAGRYDEAIEDLLAVIARRREFAEGAARAAALEIFHALGPADERVPGWRRRLASALN